MLAERFVRIREAFPKYLGLLVASTIALSGVAVAAPALAVQSAPRALSSGAVTVSVAPAGAISLAADQPLRLTVTIDNESPLPISSALVSTVVSKSPLTSRDALSDWLEGPTGNLPSTASLGDKNVDLVDAGEVRNVGIKTDADQLHLGAAGIYGVSVAVTAQGTTVATARTAISWKVGLTNPVKIALAVPLTVPAASGDFIDSKTLATYTGPNGLLTRQLNAVIDSPVAIGIDPRIIASIRVLGTSAPESARAWLGELTGATNDTFPLAWADQDLTAAIHAGVRTVPEPESLTYSVVASRFGPAPTAGASTPTPDPSANPTTPPLPDDAALVQWNYTQPKLGWPAAGSVVKDDLPKLTTAGYGSLILSSANVSVTKTSVVSGASATIGDEPVAISDDTLSALFDAAVQSPNQTEWAAAMARLNASLAQVSSLTDGAAPTMLATLARSWPTTGFRLAETVAAIRSSQWATSVNLAAALAVTPATASIAAVKQDAARTTVVQQLFTAESSVRVFSSIVKNPILLNSSRRLELLALLSNDWSTDPTGWTTATTAFLKASTKIVNSVQVVDSSQINFFNDNGSLPVLISNTSDQAVTVVVTARPETGLISIEDKQVQLTVEADSQRKAQIPVQQLSNGKVRVSIALSSLSGTPIGEVKTVRLNVQAGWETVGTLIFAALVVLIFGFGIFRNIRKRLRARREGEPADRE